MFDGAQTVESAVPGLNYLETPSNNNNGGNDGGVVDPSNTDYASIKDQLSDFRSFGASLMVGSAIDSSQPE